MTAYKLWAFILHNFRLAASYKVNFLTRYINVVVALILFYYLDRLLGRSEATLISGGTYFTFLLIGGAFSRYLELMSYAFSANLRDEMLRGTIEPLLATATPTPLALLGPSSWAIIEGSFLAGLQLFLGYLLGADLSQANWPAALIVLLFSLTSILSYGIFSVAFVIIFKRGDPINWFVNSVAYVFSGVFFPIDLLPAWLRVISYGLPFTYALRALRAALMEGASLTTLAPDLLSLFLFTLFLLPLSLFALRYAIQYLKERGELTHY